MLFRGSFFLILFLVWLSLLLGTILSVMMPHLITGHEAWAETSEIMNKSNHFLFFLTDIFFLSHQWKLINTVDERGLSVALTRVRWCWGRTLGRMLSDMVMCLWLRLSSSRRDTESDTQLAVVQLIRWKDTQLFLWVIFLRVLKCNHCVLWFCCRTLWSWKDLNRCWYSRKRNRRAGRVCPDVRGCLLFATMYVYFMCFYNKW